ncbi:unnamed protein product, partial [Closterium sp. Naga37s-1]
WQGTGWTVLPAAMMRGSAGVRGAAGKAGGGAGRRSKELRAGPRARKSGMAGLLPPPRWEGRNGQWEVDSEGCVLG